MEIIIKEKRKERIQNWNFFKKNHELSKKLSLRMSQLESSPTLYDLSLLPQLRMHTLSWNREYEIAIDITKTSWYRITFKCLDWAEDLMNDFLNTEKDKTVTKIEIIEIWDYH